MNTSNAPSPLRSLGQTGGFIVDVLMIALVIVNLLLIIFDWLFAFASINTLFQQQLPAFHNLYSSTIHSNFIFYDLWFVAVYLSEFTIRWLIAVFRQTYHRWFFYPFVHWYDLIGCIPVDAFRWLRLLRVISLVYRLQRTGIIDLSKTTAWKFSLKYYNVLIEEISDRVVLNVLDGVQQEVREGNPLAHRIENEVLKPRASQLLDYLAERITHTIEKSHKRYRDDLGSYLAQLTDEALSDTRSGAALAAVPVLGPRAIALLGNTVRELGIALVDQLVDDIRSPGNRDKIDEVLQALIEDAAVEPGQINQLVTETLLDILEQVIAQVEVQQWKVREQNY